MTPFLIMFSWLIVMAFLALALFSFYRVFVAVSAYNESKLSDGVTARARAFPKWNVILWAMVGVAALMLAANFSVWAPRNTVSAGPNQDSIMETNSNRVAAPVVEAAPVRDAAAAAAERNALTEAGRTQFQSLPDDTE